MATEFRRQQQRRGTEAQWAANDIVLLAGEIALQTGPGAGQARAKIGTGAAPWSVLPWVFEVDQTARNSIGTLSTNLASLDSRVVVLEDAASAGGSINDIVAQVNANTAAIEQRQLLLPIGTHPGELLYWDGTAFFTTTFPSAPVLGTMLYWDPAAWNYIPITPGAPGQALVIGTSNVPVWATNPAAGVPEAPTNGFTYGRRDAAWEVLPPPLSCRVETVDTATMTLALANAGAHILFTNVAGCVVTVPAAAAVPLPIGTMVRIDQRDPTAAVTVAGDTGVTLLVRPGFKAETVGQYGVVTLAKTAADEWSVSGDLAVL